MKKVGNWFAASWLNVIFLLLLGAVMIGILTFQLASLLPGVSQSEVTQAVSSRTVEAISENPLTLPHKAIQYTAQRLQHSVFAIRAASVLIGAVVGAGFFYLLRHWYSRRIALLGSVLFITSPWFLHTVRHGGSSSAFLLLFGVLVAGMWLQRSRGSLLAVLACAVLVIALLYIPGMIWFVVPLLLWQVNRIGEVLEGQNAGLLTVLSLFGLCALIPLGWALYQEPHLVRPYFGLPASFPEPLQIIKNLASLPYQLFFKGPANPEIWLGRNPLLGVFPAVMFVVGMYAYLKNRKLDRAVFVIFVALFGGVLVSLSGPVNMALFLPFVYVVVASGIAHMLQRWFTVFPHNPIARGLGTTLVVAVTLLASFAGLHQYFNAWPNTPETKAVYTKQLQ